MFRCIGAERERRYARWMLAMTAGPAAMAMAVASAYADVQHVWQDDDVLTASHLNATFDGLDGRLTTVESALVAGVELAKKAQGAAAGTFTVPDELDVAGDATVQGTLAVGFHVSVNCVFNAAAVFTDCACDAGAVAISGGGFGSNNGAVLDESRSLAINGNPGTWRVGCRPGGGGARIQCTTAMAICGRLAE